LLGAGASYAGSKKQAGASKAAANLNMDQFAINNAQQQPFIQSGYGAMSKLNTLLGLSPNPNQRMLPSPSQGPQQAYAPTPGGGVDQRFTQMPQGQPPPPMWNIPEHNMPNLPLRNILALRARNGDRQAQSMLQRMA
jgi:hypothetical protein